MRLLKIGLLAALAVVSLLFGYVKITNMTQGVTEGPVISCQQEGILEISVTDGEQALLAGMTAHDPQDGDLSDRILVGNVSQLVTENTAYVTYLVFDSHDNMAQYQRVVRYTDYRRPRISIDAPLVFAAEDTQALLECLSADDVVDGDISGRIRLSALWGTSRSDVYRVTALVSNSMGDTMTLDLPVIVQEELLGRPVIRLNRQIVYLEQGATFDPMDYLSTVTVLDAPRNAQELVTEHQVDTGVPGTYWVYYLYSENGIQGTAILTVVVL